MMATETMHATRRSLLAGSFAAALATREAEAAAPAESTWANALHARARLLAGGFDAASGHHHAAIEIALDPGFKTYWRHPGDSGLPASFDWAKSDNLAAAEPLWPAPRRFEEAGLSLYGYSEGLTLPVRVTPVDAARPVLLRLGLDYGVCKDICIPVRADLSLALARSSSPHGAIVEAALARVPKLLPLGAPDPLAVLGLERVPGSGKPMLLLRTRLPAGTEATLFAEGPDSWFLEAEGTAKAGENGIALFRVRVHEQPKRPSASVPLRFTLVAPPLATETTVDLDSTTLAR